MTLLGFTGKIKAGKTTIARLLEKKHGFVVKSYATPLKEALVQLTGLPMEYFTDGKFKEEVLDFGKSPRELMQLMGTEFVRNMVYEDFWIWRMGQELYQTSSDYNIVIDDCRFPNEVELIRKMGGLVIHLRRDYEKTTLHGAHMSEQVLPLCPGDIVIDSGDLSPVQTLKLVEERINANRQC